MKLRHFDFRRLYGVYDPALVGKRVILDNTIDDILYDVEDATDAGEILTKGQTDDVPFWSEDNGDFFWYAYVLDEDFVKEPEKPLAKVQWFRGDVRNSLARSLAREVTEHDVSQAIDVIDWDNVEGSMIERCQDIIDMVVIDYISRQ